MSAPAWSSAQTGGGTIADVERRVLQARISEQAPTLRAAHRRFLELHELIQAGERHGDAHAMKGLLLGGAQALRLSPSDPPGGVCSAGIDRMAAAHRAGGARANANGSSALCRGLELKRDAVLALPGLAQLPPYPSELDAGAEQSRLLHMHARLVDELIAESALLAELSRHCADHSIHDVARGLERYFAGLIDSLTLKLQLVAAEMYQALYTPEVVHAIGRLRAILDDKQAALAKEQAALAERLAIYRDAGREFQEIASAYSSVLQETDLIRRDIARVEQL